MSAGPALRRLGKKLVADVARCWREANAARFAPDGSIDLVFVANCKISRRLACEKNCVAHLTPRALVFRLDLFPEFQRPEPQLWQFLLDLTAKAFLFSLSPSPPPSWKHPKAIAFSPHEENFSALFHDQFRSLRHSENLPSLESPTILAVDCSNSGRLVEHLIGLVRKQQCRDLLEPLTCKIKSEIRLRVCLCCYLAAWSTNFDTTYRSRGIGRCVWLRCREPNCMLIWVPKTGGSYRADNTPIHSDAARDIVTKGYSFLQIIIGD